MKKNTQILKKSLQELRNSIDLEKKSWINLNDTNCYAYALGLDIPEQEINNHAYFPGIIGNSKIYLPNQELFTYEEFIYNLFEDFKALNIEYKEIDPLDKINIDEWKIALFITYYSKNYVEDFHFLRENKENIWYHKLGYTGTITNCDDDDNIITNPKQCFFEYRTYKKCLSLKLK